MAQDRGRGGVGLETRIALAICVVLGGALCGKAAADAARRRWRLLAALADGLQNLRIHMTGMLQPVRCALERSGCALLQKVAGRMEGGRSAADAWQAARREVLRRGGPGDALIQSDVDALDALFSQLGQSGREEQEALLGASLQTLCQLRDAARQKAGEADRLYVSLGFLIGLMLALIVI